MTRDMAVFLGLVKYWPVTPCKHGHVSERNTRTDTCMACNRERQARLKQRRSGQNARDRHVATVEVSHPDDVALIEEYARVLREWRAGQGLTEGTPTG